MNYAIMRLEKLKTYTEISARLKHNHRNFEAYNKTDINNPVIVVNDNNKTDYKELLEDKVNHTIRRDAVRGLEFVLSFTNGSIDKSDLKRWTECNIDWLSENFGGRDNIYDLSLHLDETTPHIHAVVMPLKDGKLSCYSYINGKKDLIKLQNSYAEKMSDFGLHRGKSREETKTKHKTTKQYIIDKLKEIDNLEEKVIEEIYNKLHEEIGVSPNFSKFDEFERER